MHYYKARLHKCGVVYVCILDNFIKNEHNLCKQYRDCNNITVTLQYTDKSAIYVPILTDNVLLSFCHAISIFTFSLTGQFEGRQSKFPINSVNTCNNCALKLQLYKLFVPLTMYPWPTQACHRIRIHQHL